MLPGDSMSAPGCWVTPALLWPLRCCAVCGWLWGRVSWAASLDDPCPAPSFSAMASSRKCPLSRAWLLPIPPLGISWALLPPPHPKLHPQFPKIQASWGAPPLKAARFSHLSYALSLARENQSQGNLLSLSPLPQGTPSHSWLPGLTDQQAQVSNILKKASLILISSSGRHLLPSPPQPTPPPAPPPAGDCHPPGHCGTANP